MPNISNSLFRGLSRTWLLIGSLLVILTVWAGQYSWGLDRYTYDRMLSTQTHSTSDRILIAAIDERSLEALGQWPWPRSVHAEALDRLTNGDATSILFDVAFVEPSQRAQQDKLLARAMQDAPPVFLPIFHFKPHERSTPARQLLPIDMIRQSASGVGHIDIQADSDGTVRHIKLRKSHTPQLTFSLYRHLVENTSTQPSALSRQLLDNPDAELNVRIPYRGTSFHYPRVSYIDLINGRVPDSLLEDRIVLVGATARGLGDRHPTPFGTAGGGMPGVEIQANLLSGLLQGDIIREVDNRLAVAASTIPLLVFMLLAWILQFRHLVKLTLATLSVTLGTSWTLLMLGWWWPPMISLLAVVTACILLSWLCQAVALHWFQREIGRLEAEPRVIPEPQPGQMREWGHKLHRQLRSLDYVITRIHDTRQFITDSMNSMPIATFVVDMRGDIVLSSAQAKHLLHQQNIGENENCQALLAGMTREGEAVTPTAPGEYDIDLGSLDGTFYRSAVDRHYHLKTSPLVTAVDSFEVGWLIGMIDVTSEKLAEEQRASLLRFLSHDLKAPQSSILALIKLQHSNASRLPEDELLDRIGLQAQNALSLTDSFMQLTRVEFGAMQNDVVILADVVLEALDQIWPTAQQRSIHLEKNLPDDQEGLMFGDRTYLLRTIYNLLDNAIKYSPADTRVCITLQETREEIILDIEDQGVGIPEQDLPHIFDSYQRSSGAQLSTGYGLGLSLVKTVIERHSGTLECYSTEHVGTRFRVILPTQPHLLEEEDDASQAI